MNFSAAYFSLQSNVSYVRITATPLEKLVLVAVKNTIIVASWDPGLADVRKHVLEKAGYVVLPAKGSEGVRKLCQKRQVSLVLIGYSMPPSEKRRVWNEARKVCKTPVLELYQGGKPELMESSALFTHLSHTPDDFIRTVQSILQQSTQH